MITKSVYRESRSHYSKVAHMRIAVIGSNGATGSLVVTQALARNWAVTAVARRPAENLERHRNLRVLAADVLDSASLDGALNDVDAVISTIGVGTSRQPTTLYSMGTANLVRAMRGQGSSRLIALSAVPAGPWSTSSWGQHHVVLPMLQRFFGASYDDMRIMERDLASTNADWTVVRPPRLTNGASKGGYRTSLEMPVRGGGSITRADLASSLLDVIDRTETNRRAIWVAN
jgi:putative NADH-flavin reductase